MSTHHSDFLETFLSDKIVSENAEIRDRAISSLARKIDLQSIPASLIVTRYFKVVGALLQWINDRQTKADYGRFIDVLAIFEQIAKADGGIPLLKQYQCVDFMNNFAQHCSEALGNNVKQFLKLVVQGEPDENNPAQANFYNTFDRSIETPIKQEVEIENKSIQNSATNDFKFNLASTAKNEHPVMASRSTILTGTCGGSTMPFPHNQRVLKKTEDTVVGMSACEFPDVYLSEADQQTIYDQSVSMKYNNISKTYRSSLFFEHQLLNDFPVEVFLQRGDMIKALLNTLDEVKGMYVNPIGFTPIMALLDRLAHAHSSQASVLNRPHCLASVSIPSQGYTSSLQRKIIPKTNTLSPAIPMNDFQRWCYPCCDMDSWKDAASSRPRSAESISSFDAVSLIAVRCIYNLLDRSKIGIYATLIKKCLTILPNFPHDKPKAKQFYTAALNALSDLCRQIGDEIFVSAILREIIHLILHVTSAAIDEQLMLNNLITMDGALATTLERTLYHCNISFRNKEREILAVLEAVNPHAVRRYNECTQISEAAKDVQTFQRRYSSMPGGQLKITSSIQFEEAVVFFQQFCSSIELQSSEFPIEDYVPEILNYGSLLSLSCADQKYSPLPDLLASFSIFFASATFDMRARMINRLVFKLRTAHEMRNSGSMVNYQALANFLTLPKALEALLIQEMTKDQQIMLRDLGDLLTLSFHLLTPKERADPSRLASKMKTLQCLAEKNGQFKGLMSLSEQESDYAWLLRVLRDLWNKRTQARMTASSTLMNKLDIAVSCNRDFLYEAFGPVDKISTDTHHSVIESESIDGKGFDAQNLLKMARSSFTDIAFKKTSIEQLVLLLSDSSNKFREFLVEGKESAFATCTATLFSGFSSLMGADAFEPNYLDFISATINFVWRSFFRFRDVVEPWFANFKNQSEETLRVLETLQAALLKHTHIGLRQNALKLLEIILFHSTSHKLENQKIFQIHSLELNVFNFIFSSVSSTVIIQKLSVDLQVLKNQRPLSPLFKIYLSQKLDGIEKASDERKSIEQNFLIQSRVQKDLKELRESWDFLSNYLLISWDNFDVEQILAALSEVLKTLPISEQQASFASDFIENMSSVFDNPQGSLLPPLEIFIENYASILTRHILPFLFETGATALTQHYHVDYLHNIFQLTLSLLKAEKSVKSSNPSGLLISLARNQKFVDYLHQLFVFFKSTPLIRADIIRMLSTLVATGYSLDLQLHPFARTILNYLAAAQSTSQSFNDCALIKRSLLFLKSMHARGLASLESESPLPESPLAREIVDQFNSFGWLIRFVGSRDAKIRTMAWSLLTDFNSPKLLETHPSIIGQALSSVLQDGELYAVKTQSLSFLLSIVKILETYELCDDSSELPTPVADFLSEVHKTGFISQAKTLAAVEGAPALFLDALMEFLRALIDLDFENTLSVLTQLDMWTLVALLADYEKLHHNETTDPRQGFLINKDRAYDIDALHACMASIGQLIQTALLRQQSIASYLSGNTCLVEQLLNLGSQLYSTQQKEIEERDHETLLPSAITSIAGALQGIAAETRDEVAYKIAELLAKKPENLDFILNFAFQSSNPELQLAVGKMGASLLRCVTKAEDIKAVFDNSDPFEEQEEGVSSRGALLIEVINDAFSYAFERVSTASTVISDICMSASCVVTKSMTAKIQACRGDFIARVSAHAERLMSGVFLKELGSLKKKGTVSQVALEEGKIASQQLVWVLEIFKHLFYDSGELVLRDMLANAKNKKSEPSVFIALFAKLLKQTTPAQSGLRRQIIQTLVTLASQSPQAKLEFTLFLKQEKSSFLQIIIHLALQTSPFTNRPVLLSLLELLKTLAMAVECVHAMIRVKFVPDLLAQLDPLLRQKKDVKELGQLLEYVLAFLAAFSWNQEGRKALLASKASLELSFFVLEGEGISKKLIVTTLTFLRNICFQGSTKPNFALNKRFVPSVLGLLQSETSTPKIKETAATTLWNLVYNHQGLKALLGKADIKEQLHDIISELDKDIDKAKYLPKDAFPQGTSASKIAQTLETYSNTRKAIELTVALLD